MSRKFMWVAADHHPHLIAATALFLVLVGLYSLSYSGLLTSGDEFAMFDSIASFVRRGNFLRTIEFNTVPQFQPDGTPALDAKYEPLQLLLSAPLMLLARYVPEIGIVHTVWLFNIFVTAMTAVVVYVVGIIQGYSIRTAWITALIFGVATIAWPYSRWFYREPLAGFFVLTVYGIAVWISQKRTKDRSFPYYYLPLLVSVIAAILTKQVTLLVIPGLLMFLLLEHPKRSNIRIALILAVTVVAIVLVLGSVLTLDEDRYRWQAWLENGLSGDRWDWMIESFIGYQISPARGIWLHSPVLLLGIPGAIMLIRRGKFWLVAGPLSALVLFGVGYGAWRTWNWWGGWGWGPRYMLPLVPLLMLWLFPVIDWIVERQRKLLWYVLLGILILLSVAIQVIGLAVPYTNFYTELHHTQLTQPNPLEWGRWADFNWRFVDTPFAYHIRHLNFDQLDIVWPSANPPWLVPVVSVFIIIVGLAVLDLSRRRRFVRSPIFVILAAVMLSVLVSLAILFSLRSDPRYITGKEDIKQLIDELNSAADADEVVYLDRGEYIPFFMNYYKSPAILITLPYAPGERFGPQEPLVVSDNPVDLAGHEAVAALQWAANNQHEFWLAASSGPFNTEMLRPIEHYLVTNYFPVSEITVSQRARAVKFLPVNTATGMPSIEANYQFGDDLQLVGYDLPRGTEFSNGEIIPISLVWHPTAPLPLDYNVSVFLANEARVVVAQRDGPPQGTFGHMSRWHPEMLYRDNHGLQLPAELPSGEYQLYVVVYSWQDQNRLEVRFDGASPGTDEAPLAAIVIGEE